MPAFLARALVFSTSAAVLVLEILAGRLLAPYVGVSIETFTGIIGVVLAGISLGAWLGGRAADRLGPRGMLGPLLVAGGILALLAPTVVHWIGPSMQAAGPGEIVLLALLAFFLPAAVLSAVTPIVVKLRLASLDETGTVVGTLSAVGTAGAIFGTFLTGFVLIATLPSDGIVLVVGAALVLTGIGIWVAPRRSLLAGVVLPAAVAGSILLVWVDGPCDEETTYACAYVTEDPGRPGGRVLWLDDLRHSYVDLDDPGHLEFRYTKVMADVFSTLEPGPLDVLSIGGGGFTLPRYLPAVRPGSRSVVLEIDGSLVDIAEEHLGLTDRDDLRVEIGDARVSLRDEPRGAYDVVVGDAFGSRSVPWHLTTREFLEDVEERLHPEGVYLLNLIDQPPHDFARAEAATLLEVFDHVAMIVPPSYVGLRAGGNIVFAASNGPVDLAGIRREIASRGGAEVVVADLAGFVDGARSLTDAFAPVDQLIGRR